MSAPYGKVGVFASWQLIHNKEGRALFFGNAYEYLMRHFAAESGKGKGQFCTPAEVSRIMAQIIGIRGPRTNHSTTVNDPTCKSGALLLKVDNEAHTKVTLYGQEKDAATSGLARMNMILHAAIDRQVGKNLGVKADKFFVQKTKTNGEVAAPVPKTSA